MVNVLSKLGQLELSADADMLTTRGGRRGPGGQRTGGAEHLEVVFGKRGREKIMNYLVIN